MSRRKGEITGHMNERNFPHWLSLRFRQVASAAEVQSLRRFTVSLATRSARPRPTRHGDVCSREGENHARSPERRDEGI